MDQLPSDNSLHMKDTRTGGDRCKFGQRALPQQPRARRKELRGRRLGRKLEEKKKVNLGEVKNARKEDEEKEELRKRNITNHGVCHFGFRSSFPESKISIVAFHIQTFLSFMHSYAASPDSCHITDNFPCMMDDEQSDRNKWRSDISL